MADDLRQHVLLGVQFTEPEAGDCDITVEAVEDDGYGMFRVHHTGQPYEVYTSLTSECARVGSGLTLDVEDILEFHLARSTELSRYPSGSVAYAWQGRDCGGLTIAGKTASIAKASIGACVCTYASTYDLWQLPQGWDAVRRVAVVVLCADAVNALGFDPEQAAEDEAAGLDDAETVAEALDDGIWSGDQGDTVAFSTAQETIDGETVTVTMTVVDYCTGDPIPGANVSTPYGGGTTNAAGEISIGPVPRGTRVSVRADAVGYSSSSEDVLLNDSVVAS